MASVAVYDTGGWVDDFCMATSIMSQNKLQFTDAFFWNKEIFPNLTTRKIEEDIAKLNEHFKFDVHICETNNYGNYIISDLRRIYKIPVRPITTTGNSNPDTIKALNKNRIVPYINKFREEGIITFPKELSRGLKYGLEQLNNYGSKTSVQGKTTYQAIQGHDDFVSCVIIHTDYFMKHFWSHGKKPLVSYTPRRKPETSSKEVLDRVRRMMGAGKDEPIKYEFLK